MTDEAAVPASDAAGSGGPGGVTGSGYEYTATVDQDALTCSGEYEGTQIDIEQTVTIQILNPDGEDTVMAELEYTPEALAEF